MKEENPQTRSFLVPMWELALTWLEKVSFFYLLRWKFPVTTRKYWFVDTWVFGHLIISIASVYLVSYGSTPQLLAKIIAVYGFMRVFEIFIYQLNVLLVHPFRKESVSTYTLLSYRRMTVALIHNFFEIIFWFATTYVAFQFTFEHSLEKLNPIIIIYYSFLAMVSYTSNLDKSGWTLFATSILHVQAIIGLFMTVLSFARFITLLPKAETMDELEKEYTIYDNIQRIEQQLENINAKLESKDKEEFQEVNSSQNEKD